MKHLSALFIVIAIPVCNFGQFNKYQDQLLTIDFPCETLPDIIENIEVCYCSDSLGVYQVHKHSISPGVRLNEEQLPKIYDAFLKGLSRDSNMEIVSKKKFNVGNVYGWDIYATVTQNLNADFAYTRIIYLDGFMYAISASGYSYMKTEFIRTKDKFFNSLRLTEKGEDSQIQPKTVSNPYNPIHILVIVGFIAILAGAIRLIKKN